MAIWLYGYMAIWLYGYMAIWLYNAMRLFGYLAIYGYIWLCGYLAKKAIRLLVSCYRFMIVGCDEPSIPKTHMSIHICPDMYVDDIYVWTLISRHIFSSALYPRTRYLWVALGVKEMEERLAPSGGYSQAAEVSMDVYVSCGYGPGIYGPGTKVSN